VALVPVAWQLAAIWLHTGSELITGNRNDIRSIINENIPVVSIQRRRFIKCLNHDHAQVLGWLQFEIISFPFRMIDQRGFREQLPFVATPDTTPDAGF
jgi:hypothetical protein